MSARETPCFSAMTRANLVTRTSLPRPAVRRICRWMSTRTRWINMAAPHWPERCCRSQVRCSWRTVALFGSSGPCHCLRRPCGQFSTGDCVDAGNSKPILPTLRKHRRPPSYVRVLPSGSPAGPTFRSCGDRVPRRGVADGGSPCSPAGPTGQPASAGRLTSGSSLKGAMVSRVM
jgi:hypothetical protein